MKAKNDTSAILALILVLAALLALPASAGAAATLQVNGATGLDTGNCAGTACKTIAYAISQAASGDKIHVAAGHYEQHLTIDKQLTLEGEAGTEIGPLGGATVVPFSTITLGANADGAVLKGLELRSAAEAQATIATTGGGEIDGVAIEGVTEAGLGPQSITPKPHSTVAAGLEISVPTAGWTITDSSFDLNYFGIVVNNDSSDMTVAGVTFTHDRSGFYTQRKEPSPGTFVGEVDGLEMTDCEFIEDQYRGMYFEGLSHATIEGVTVLKAGATAPTHPFGARGISLNLKNGAYEDIRLIDANVSEAENEGISVQVRGSAEDSSTYRAHPATLDSVEITESTVIDNDGPGIVVENSTQLGAVTVSGSRIVGNARDGIPAGDTAGGIDAWDEDPGAPTVDGADNWFGCNAGPGNGAAGCDTVDGPVIAGTWLVLTGAAEAPTVALGGSTLVRAAIDTNSAGQPAAEVPAGTPVAFAAGNGAVAPPTAHLFGGEAQATYVAGLPGSAGLTATVDNQTVAVPLTVAAPPPAEESKAEEPKREEAKQAPAPAPAAPVTIEPTETKTPPVVAPSGNVTVATVECASSSCQVEAKKPAVTIGGQSFKVKVKVPATVAGGEAAPVKVVLPKKAREALEEKGKGTVKVQLTVTTADGQTKTVTVTVVVKAKKGKKK